MLTSFQAEQFLQGRWRGFTIGQYKYLERIGVGGMGQVFLCEHIESKRRVAIKVLPPAEGRATRGARPVLSRNPRLAAPQASQHRPHARHRSGRRVHFIVMDYVAGSNLLDVVKRFGPMESAGRPATSIRSALALDFAFRNKIIHRDVKPGNVMIDWQGVARLLDLGLARFLNDHGDQLTLKYDDKIVLGTADYVAPEQIENSHAVETRADIYARARRFDFLLAGHPPFPTRNGVAETTLAPHQGADADSGSSTRSTGRTRGDPRRRRRPKTPRTLRDPRAGYLPTPVVAFPRRSPYREARRCQAEPGRHEVGR